MTEPGSTEPGGGPGSGRDVPGGGRLQRGFEQGLSLAQLTVLLPVVVLLLSAFGAFVYGTVVVVHFVVDIVAEPFAVTELSTNELPLTEMFPLTSTWIAPPKPCP